MIQNDAVGVALVYIYVALLLLLTEKILVKYPQISRKILHIMTGNIAFFLPIFQTREVMAFIAAGPFILFTFLMSPFSPLKNIKGKTSEAGHGLGLVYYAISWTILAYFFFDQKIIIAVGILAMSYGDGFASVLGSKFGNKIFNIFKDEKSIIGSLSMFVFTLIPIIFAMVFYTIPVTTITISYLIAVSMVATVIEAITPKGLDNLSVPLITSLTYLILMP